MAPSGFHTANSRRERPNRQQWLCQHGKYVNVARLLRERNEKFGCNITQGKNLSWEGLTPGWGGAGVHRQGVRREVMVMRKMLI